jgi:hypothetical protein
MNAPTKEPLCCRLRRLEGGSEAFWAKPLKDRLDDAPQRLSIPKRPSMAAGCRAECNACENALIGM